VLEVLLGAGPLAEELVEVLRAYAALAEAGFGLAEGEGEGPALPADRDPANGVVFELAGTMSRARSLA
jgi:hypothetical protein